MHGSKAMRGFTLIEVLVVMVIVAILAAVAIPNYTQYIQRGRRAEAKATLLQIVQWQERMRTQQNAYVTATANLPAGLQTVLINGQAIYNVTINAGATANNYTLTATRAGVMAADGCGDFTLDSLGVRGLVNNTAAMNECWNR